MPQRPVCRSQDRQCQAARGKDVYKRQGQVGYEKSLLGGGRKWYFDDNAFNRINVYADFDITHRFDGQLLERELEARVNAQGPMQSGLTLHALTRSRFWKGKLFDEHLSLIHI